VLANLALGTVAGFMAIVAPARLGIREGLGTPILALVVGAEAGLLSLVLLRGIPVVMDLSLALLSIVSGTRSQAPE
jgi:hypothetical protein